MVAQSATGGSGSVTTTVPTPPATPLPPLRGADWLLAHDPRLRLLAAGLFALVVVSLDQLSSSGAALALALGLTVAARLDARALARRLLALTGFLLIMLLTLPFTTPGASWFTLGSLSASTAGRDLALLILCKATAVMLTLTILVGTLDPLAFAQALGRLGVPHRLTQLLLLTIRQIHLIDAESIRLRQALRARAFVPRTDWQTWRTYGWLIGMLLVRSFARAERLLEAMRCRGFRGRFYRLDTPTWRMADSLAALGWLLLLGGLLWLDQHVDALTLGVML